MAHDRSRRAWIVVISRVRVRQHLVRDLRIARFIMALGAAMLNAPGIIAQPSEARTWRARVNAMIRDTVLANGLTVIVAEQRAVPITTVNVVVRTGAFTQQPGDEGISHVYEHLLFRAYGKDQRFVRDVAELNGFYNGTTSDEAVNYFVTVPSEGTEDAIRILARLVTEARFRDSDLEAEKRIVLNEFERDASSADFLLNAQMGRRLWAAEWARKDPLGTPESIRAFTIPRIKDIYARYYVPNNAAVVVSGDVDASIVFKQAADRFRRWKMGPDPHGAHPVSLAGSVAGAPSQTFTVGGDHQHLITLKIQWAGPSVRANAAATHAADVFSELLNASVSPMIERLVNSGLMQSVSMSYLTRNRRGPIELVAVMLPSAAEQAIPQLREEISRFAAPDYLSDSLVTIARTERGVSSEYWLERGSALAHTLAFWWSIAGLDYFRSYVDDLQRVDRAGIDRYVRDFIVGQFYVAGALVPAREVDRITRIMDATFGTGRVP